MCAWYRPLGVLFCVGASAAGLVAARFTCSELDSSAVSALEGVAFGRSTPEEIYGKLPEKCAGCRQCEAIANLFYGAAEMEANTCRDDFYAVQVRAARFDPQLPQHIVRNRTRQMLDVARRDAAIRDAFLAASDLLGRCKLRHWPLQGTLVGFMRYGSMTGVLSEGKVDAVGWDLEFAVEALSVWDWGVALQTCLQPFISQDGLHWSGTLHAGPQTEINQNLIYHPDGKGGAGDARYGVMVQLYPYHEHTDASGRKFFYRYSERGRPTDVRMRDECDNNGFPRRFCRIATPYRHNGWIPAWRGGMLPREMVYPLRTCEAYGKPISCPRRPVLLLRAFYNVSTGPRSGFGCFILPVLSAQRQAADPRNHKLWHAGLRLADLDILEAHSRRLQAAGYANFMSGDGRGVSNGVACLQHARKIAARHGSYAFAPKDGINAALDNTNVFPYRSPLKVVSTRLLKLMREAVDVRSLQKSRSILFPVETLARPFGRFHYRTILARRTPDTGHRTHQDTRTPDT